MNDRDCQPPIRRRAWQVRLRTLLLGMAAVAAAAAWLGNQWRQSAWEGAFAEDLRGHGLRVELYGPYDVTDDDPRHNDPREPQDWWRTLARRSLGERIGLVAVRDPYSGSESARNGSIDFDRFARLTYLRRLDLTETNIGDLAPLAGLTTLEVLRLGETRIDDLAPLARLAQLKVLDLHQTQVHDLTPLAGLARLQELDLTDTRVSQIRPLAGLKYLAEVLLAGAPVRDLSPLAGLSLRELSLPEGFTQQQFDWLVETQPRCYIHP